MPRSFREIQRALAIVPVQMRAGAPVLHFRWLMALAMMILVMMTQPCAGASSSWLEGWLGVSILLGPVSHSLAAGPSQMENGLRPLELEGCPWQPPIGSGSGFEIQSLSPGNPAGALPLAIDPSRWSASAGAALIEITLERPDSSWQTIRYDGDGPVGSSAKAFPLGFLESPMIASASSRRCLTAWALLAIPRFGNRQSGRPADTESLRICSSKPVFLHRISIRPVLGDWPGLCQKLAERAFRRVLGRSPSPRERQRATLALANGHIDLGLFMARLALSPEYLGRVRRGHRAESLVAQLHRAMHDQPLSERGVNTTAQLWRRKGPDEAIRSLLRLDRLSNLDWVGDCED